MWRLTLAVACTVLSTGCLEKRSTYRLKGGVPEGAEGFSNALYQSVGVHLVGGNQVEPANNGAFFDVLVNELKAAQRSINIVLFIWRPGDPSNRIVSAVIERARAGVKCRVLVDHLGSMEFEREVQPVLESAGCEVHVFRHLKRQLSVDRNHRKIFVIDGEIGFTGGVGIFKVWLGDGLKPDEWRESNVKVRGPVVTQMQQAFAENWLEETGTFLPTDDFPQLTAKGDMLAAFVTSSGSDQLTRAERLTQLVITAAKKRVWIGNAYFLPSPGLFELIVEKQKAGVDVRVMTPSGTTDHPEVLVLQRGRYKNLLEAGVRVFEYQPTMFHPKTMLVDDAIATVGSINFDKLSQDWLEEGSLVVYDDAFAKELERAWEKDAVYCEEMKR